MDMPSNTLKVQSADERGDEQPRVKITILNDVSRGRGRAEAEPPRAAEREWAAGAGMGEVRNWVGTHMGGSAGRAIHRDTGQAVEWVGSALVETSLRGGGVVIIQSLWRRP